MKFDISTIVVQPQPKYGTYHDIYNFGGRSVTLTKAPTGNCQFYSIGCAMNILTYQNFPELFAYLHNTSLKKRLLIDIPRVNCKKIEEFFNGKDDIIFKQDYVNSTYSTNMTIYMLSTEKLAVLSKELQVKEIERQKQATIAARKPKVTSVDPNDDTIVTNPFTEAVGQAVRRRVGRPKKVVEAHTINPTVEINIPTYVHNGSGITNIGLVEQMRQLNEEEDELSDIENEIRMQEEAMITQSEAPQNSYNIPW